ncbi:hypothetical protein ACHAW6_002296 [Cyclotella cf. meneghiniana]
MSRKNHAHDALGLRFAQEGFPPKMIVDNAKEMKSGEFAWKCKEATCYLRGTKPYSPWSNSAEWNLRKVQPETDSVRCAQAAVVLCTGVRYKSYVCLHTAHDIFQLDSHMPETVISGKTADICLFCEFGFWGVKFLDKVVAFPDDQKVLGKYLGPSMDVGLAMMQHVVKTNGKYEDRSTLL